MSGKSIFMSLILLIVLVFSFSMVNANETDQNNDVNLIIKDQKVSERDFLFAGSEVSANSIFDTTTFFAGSSVNLDGEYNGDVFVAGNTVNINGKINGNLYATGNVIILNGEVSDDVFFAGSDFTISSSASVIRDVFVASANASFAGKIGRNLRVSAGNMMLNGTVGGFVETDVDHLTINDNAEVLGSIDHRSTDQATVSENANIPSVNWEKVDKTEKSEAEKTTSVGSIIYSLMTKLAFIILIWVFLTFLSREFSENMLWIVKKHIWASLGLGVAYLFLAPIIIFLSFIVYVPFGIAIILLIIASFILAMPIAAIVFSKLLIRIFEGKVKALLASFLAILCLGMAIILISLVPYLGGILSFIMIVFGIGFLSYNILFAKAKLKNEKNLQAEYDYQIREESKPVQVKKTSDNNQSEVSLSEELNEELSEKE